MRREYDDSEERQRSHQRRDAESAAAATASGDEFVDILQVQQLLLEGGRGPPPPPVRLLDAAPTYCYGYGAQHGSTSVDDLVALWFAGGPPVSGVWCFLLVMKGVSKIIHSSDA